MNKHRGRVCTSGIPLFGILFVFFFEVLPGMPFSICYGGMAGAGVPPDTAQPGFRIKNCDFAKQTVLVSDPSPQTVSQYQRVGEWSLMAVFMADDAATAVFENLAEGRGSIVFMTEEGVVLTLPKSLVPTSVPEETLYRGRSLQETIRRGHDFMANEILAQGGDPTFAEVAACLPPLRAPTFVGTVYSVDKPTFDYGGFSDEIYIDAGKLVPEIQAARDRKDVQEGLIGAWLPVVRFVFPAGEGRYWEEVIFADEDPSKFWTQPVWYRLLLVEDGGVLEHHYFEHHLLFPPRGEPPAGRFFSALNKVFQGWRDTLNPSMTIEVPDRELQDFCLHAFVREMITRVGDHPKYGYPPLGGIDVFGGYGYSNVDTFQDVFNSSVMTFLEWGLFDKAGAYIDDYFTHSVREDGSIDTRGPEIGQYGRMLTALAMYRRYVGDEILILKHLGKIQAVIRLFFELRKQSKQVPAVDESYGIIRGWSEHDCCLKVNPFDLMLPHFSNNAEAARGFHDLGTEWIAMGENRVDQKLKAEGRLMLQEAEAMKVDLLRALEKSVDRSQSPPYLPAVAHDTPTWGKGRVYTELLHSGILPREFVEIINAYQSENGHRILGLSGGGRTVSGFRAFGPAYGLIQHDRIREFLLFFHAQRAHLYTRGTWTAVEGAGIDGTMSGPYCTPTQLTIPALTKWMLVFEDPDEPILWLAKATPRAWLADGEGISVSGAPTRFGFVGYDLRSFLEAGMVKGTLSLPEAGLDAVVHIRLRVPGGHKMTAVAVNGNAWEEFDPGREIITLPRRMGGCVELEVGY